VRSTARCLSCTHTNTHTLSHVHTKMSECKYTHTFFKDLNGWKVVFMCVCMFLCFFITIFIHFVFCHCPNLSADKYTSLRARSHQMRLSKMLWYGAFLIFSRFSGAVKSLNILNFKCRSSMSHSANAANRIKQEAGFRSCFPDENLILAVFNSEELYNSKSKRYSNSLLLGRKCN